MPVAAVPRTMTAKVALVADLEDGGYSAVSLTVPGVFGQGDTEEAALADLAAAIRDTVQCFEAKGLPLGEPLTLKAALDPEDIPNATERRIVVQLA